MSRREGGRETGRVAGRYAEPEVRQGVRGGFRWRSYITLLFVVGFFTMFRIRLFICTQVTSSMLHISSVLSRERRPLSELRVFSREQSNCPIWTLWCWGRGSCHVVFYCFFGGSGGLCTPVMIRTPCAGRAWIIPCKLGVLFAAVVYFFTIFPTFPHLCIIFPASHPPCTFGANRKALFFVGV